MTVEELYEACRIEIGMGNGKRNVVISNDEEGNGYHDLFYSFLRSPQEIRHAIDNTCSWGSVTGEVENMIILG